MMPLKRNQMIAMGCLVLLIAFPTSAQADEAVISKQLCGEIDNLTKIDPTCQFTIVGVDDPLAGDLYSRQPSVDWETAECTGFYSAVETTFAAKYEPELVVGPIALKTVSAEVETKSTALYWKYDCWVNDIELKATAQAHTQSLERQVSLQVSDQADNWETIDSCTYRTVTDLDKEGCSVSETLPVAYSKTDTHGLLPTKTLPVSREVCVKNPSGVRAIETTRVGVPEVDYPFEPLVVGWDHFADTCRTLEIAWDDLDEDSEILDILNPPLPPLPCVKCLVPDGEDSGNFAERGFSILPDHD